jgi:hypothetical protein
MICADYVGLEAKETEKERGVRKRKRLLLKILMDYSRERSYFIHDIS